MTENKLISIVVPVYNVEEYLENCIASLLRQNYKPLQIILVDDGSTDNSGCMCDEFSKKYSFIDVIHKSNGGLSSARNAGMSLIKGKYFLFIDSDDWLDDNYIESIMNVLNKTDFDILFTDFVKEYPQKSVITHLALPNELNLDTSKSNYVLQRLFGETGKQLRHPARIEDFNTAWAHVYKSQKFQKLQFIDGKEIRSEDLWFNIEAFYQSKNYYHLKNVYYHYNKQNEGSIVSSYDSILLEQYKNLYLKMAKFIKEKRLNEGYEVALNNRIILNLISVVINYSFNPKNKNSNKLKRVLKDKIYKDAFKKFDYSELPLSYKAFFKLCEYNCAWALSPLTKFAMKNRYRIKR